jgi:hypothetical protein
MNNYSEEMLNFINSIRKSPESFIKYIDNVINNNIQKINDDIYIVSKDVDEKIKLMDNYIEMFDKAKNILKEKMDIQKKRIKLVKMVYNEDLEISLEETNYLDYYYAKEFEEQIDENEEENNIKNIPIKLGLIYDYDEINILDDDSKEDINEYESIKPKENLDIIDFDEENNSEIFTKENSKNKVVGVTDHYKIIISNNDINSHQNKYKREKKLKGKKKNKNKNNNKFIDLNDDKIGNLILNKRKEIKEQYPLNIFKLSVIKDIKISILIQIIMEELYKNNQTNKLKEIIFDPKYKNFAVSWANEINRNFVSISCFA